MQGYIESDLIVFQNKKILAEAKAKEIAVRSGYHLDENGSVIGKNPAGEDQPGKQATSSLFEISKSAVDENYFALSFRNAFPTTFAEIESYAGLVLVDIPDDYFPKLED